MTETKDSNLQTLFNAYVKTIDTIHPTQMLHKVKIDLCGLKECATKGPTEDKVPSYSFTPDEYYAWDAWRKYSDRLTEENLTGDKLKSIAMKSYITKAHAYLTHLKLVY
jgi:hypothetical protein